MKRLLILSVLVGLAACADQPIAPDMAMPDLIAQQARVWNGFPQGSHDYKLNIIGVSKDKTAFVVDPSAEAAERESGVGGRARRGGERLLQGRAVGVVVDRAPQDL